MTLAALGYPVESRGLSNEQLGKLQAFKRLLQQTGAWDDKVFDEHDCARFLKARNYDLQAAKQMWDSMLQWRRENRVDTIQDWFVFHERKAYDAVFPTGLHKTDKEGHPVLIQQLGRVNIGALYKVTTDDRIRLAHIAENEHLRRVVFPACSRAAGRPIDQLFTIIDLEGVAFTSMMRTTSLLKMFMAMDSNNYPETLARMAIINAPGWFSTSWGAVKSVLSGDTVRKIQILGKDYQAALLQHIPRENLLVEYGGLSRGSVTDNDGPWLEPIPEPPAPAPVPPPLPLPPKQIPSGSPEVAMGPTQMSSGGGGDQRTPRDVYLNRRSQSPVRPGAKPTTPLAAVTGVSPPNGMAPAGHQTPPISPPIAKRPHHEEPPQQQQQPQAQPGPGQHAGNSPAPSVSDAASDTSQSMVAPLMSNFLPSAAEAFPPVSGGASQAAAGPGSPLLAGGGPGSGVPAALSMRRGSSTGGSGSLVHGLVAGLQAVASHVGYHPQHTGPRGPGAAMDGTPLHASSSLVAGASPVGALGQRTAAVTPQHQQHHGMAPLGLGGAPAQLQLSSPREDTPGPATLFSAVSSTYSQQSPFSPASTGEGQAISDTATSRAPDGGACGVASGVLAQPAVSPLGAGSTSLATVSGPYSRQISAGGSSMGHGGGGQAVGVGQVLGGAAGGSSIYASGVLASMELVPSVSQPQPQVSTQQTETDDAESVRFSVMSQRSFYSALSHIDPSNSSGLTSPNEASENARRWSMQRELHAAAIASALAATAEQRRAAAAAAAAAGTPQPSLPPSAASKGLSGMGPAPASPALPSALTLASVTYPVAPAAQQAFGSYLDQPPPYGSLRTGDSSFSGASQPSGAGTCGGPDGKDCPPSGAAAGTSSVAGHGQDGTARPGHSDQHHQHQQQLPAGPRDAIALHVSGDGGAGTGGLSRSPSGATIDDCSLGAGAVRWARGWFFRRRNYGRLVESDGTADASGIVGGSRLAGGSAGGAGPDGGRQTGQSLTRKGSSGALYASIHDGPLSTSPSKVLPKNPPGVHHSRGNSWEWDQPSPYDIDQTYGRSGGIMQRDMSFGRGGERRRLLRTDSPGRRRGIGEHCGCLPCCTVM